MKKRKKLIVEVVSFGIIGVVSLLIDLSVTVSLYNILHAPAYLASGIGFLSAFFFNFPMNRKRVFHHSINDRFKLKPQVVMYMSLSGFNLLSTSFLTEVIVSNGILKIGMTKLFVTALIAMWNFVIFKWIIFSKKTTDLQTS